MIINYHVHDAGRSLKHLGTSTVRPSLSPVVIKRGMEQ